MRSLSLDQLRAMLEVSELGSFSAAARRLNLTQPAVSLQVRELEDRFGLPLIERLGRRAYPTAAGRELIEHARRMIAEAERAQTAMRRHKDGHIGRVHVGTGITALLYLLPPVLERLRQNYPDIELIVTTGTTHGVIQRMLANVIDLGFITLPVDETEFEVTPVHTEPLFAILPPQEAKPPAAVDPAYIAARPLILEYERANHTRLTRQWLHAAGFDVRPIMEIDNIEAIKKLVSAGLGVSIVPSLALENGHATHGFLVRPVEPRLERTLAVVQRRDKPDDPALRIAREALLSLRNDRIARPTRRKTKPVPKSKLTRIRARARSTV